MDVSKRMVNIFFVGATLLTWIIFTKAFGEIFRAANIHDIALLGKGFKMSNLVGAVVTLAALFWVWRHRTIRPTINEVCDELSKVVWPSWDETKSNTVVTVIVTIIIGAILWVFDQVFGNLTSIILG